jgi:hypothetical protein
MEQRRAKVIQKETVSSLQLRKERIGVRTFDVCLQVLAIAKVVIH